MPDGDAMSLPITCPADYLFNMDKWDSDPGKDGTPISVREYSFLDNKRTPKDVKVGLLACRVLGYFMDLRVRVVIP
jgi:hypothetical protein